jgi:hypothetical protein
VAFMHFYPLVQQIDVMSLDCSAHDKQTGTKCDKWSKNFSDELFIYFPYINTSEVMEYNLK